MLLICIKSFTSITLIVFCLDKRPPNEWPNKGQIIFDNFYLRYTNDTPYVLKNLNIKIQSMEKVIKHNIFKQ